MLFSLSLSLHSLLFFFLFFLSPSLSSSLSTYSSPSLSLHLSLPHNLCCLSLSLYIYIYPVGLTPGPRNDRNLANSRSTFDDDPRSTSILHCQNRGFRDLFFFVFFENSELFVFVFRSNFRSEFPLRFFR